MESKVSKFTEQLIAHDVRVFYNLREYFKSAVIPAIANYVKLDSVLGISRGEILHEVQTFLFEQKNQVFPYTKIENVFSNGEITHLLVSNNHVKTRSAEAMYFDKTKEDIPRQTDNILYASTEENLEKLAEQISKEKGFDVIAYKIKMEGQATQNEPEQSNGLASKTTGSPSVQSTSSSLLDMYKDPTKAFIPDSDNPHLKNESTTILNPHLNGNEVKKKEEQKLEDKLPKSPVWPKIKWDEVDEKKQKQKYQETPADSIVAKLDKKYDFPQATNTSTDFIPIRELRDALAQRNIPGVFVHSKKFLRLISEDGTTRTATSKAKLDYLAQQCYASKKFKNDVAYLGFRWFGPKPVINDI